MNVVQRDIPLSACTVDPSRPIKGIVLHHTATSTVPFPQKGASWHYCIGPDGTVYADVSDENAAHHTGATDRWRPSWVEPSPVGVSDINHASIGIEITYAPQNGEVPNDAQYTALHDLIGELYGFYGALPVIGHGEVDLSRWPTEPHALDWTRAGFGPRTAQGRYLLPAEEDEVSLRDELNAVTAERDQLNGVNKTLGEQLAAKDALLVKANSDAGAWQEEAQKRQQRLEALQHDMLQPLQDQLESLRRQLDLAAHRSAKEVVVVLDDGTSQRFTPTGGS